MKKINFLLILSVIITLSILSTSCSSDDNNNIELNPDEVIIDENLILGNWNRSKAYYLDSSFKIIQEIELPPCELASLTFNENIVKMKDVLIQNGECTSYISEVDYLINRNEVYTYLDDQTKFVFLKLLSFNSKNLSTYQEVDAKESSTIPSKAKYLKYDYFKYDK